MTLGRVKIQKVGAAQHKELVLIEIHSTPPLLSKLSKNSHEFGHNITFLSSLLLNHSMKVRPGALRKLISHSISAQFLSRTEPGYFVTGGVGGEW